MTVSFVIKLLTEKFINPKIIKYSTPGQHHIVDLLLAEPLYVSGYRKQSIISVFSVKKVE